MNEKCETCGRTLDELILIDEEVFITFDQCDKPKCSICIDNAEPCQACSL